MLKASDLASLFGDRSTASPRTSRCSAGAPRSRHLAAERLEARTMFAGDVSLVGTSAPPAAVPVQPPVQTTPAVTDNPRPLINISISITVNSPAPSPSATPAPTTVAPPALPAAPTVPSANPGDELVEPYDVLMNPPESWRDIAVGNGPVSVPVGTFLDYAAWLAKIYVAGAPPVGEFDGVLDPDFVPATHPGPSSPPAPPPVRPFFGPNPHHPKGVGGPWQH